MTKRILLVDDDRFIRESLSKILQAESYEVVLAENGQEAIEKHGAERIDLLILDLNMPVKNGWATLDQSAVARRHNNRSFKSAGSGRNRWCGRPDGETARCAVTAAKDSRVAD